MTANAAAMARPLGYSVEVIDLGDAERGPWGYAVARRLGPGGGLFELLSRHATKAEAELACLRYAAGETPAADGEAA